MAVAERTPTLSVYELVLLFDDHPTVPLVLAICQQAQPADALLTNRVLLAAMYGVPVNGNLPEWFGERVTDEHARLLDLGLGMYRQGRSLAGL